MIKKMIYKLAERYGVWRLIQAVLFLAVSIMFIVSAAELVIPVRIDLLFPELSSDPDAIEDVDLSDFLRDRKSSTGNAGVVTRPGLFKPSAPLRDKPLADKTIEKIKSQLNLQCIMNIKGEPVAYINITGVGLTKCMAGDNVSDMFTVLKINKNSVEIKIIEHKVSLSL